MVKREGDLQTLIDMEKMWQDDRPALKRNNSNPEKIAKALRAETTELLHSITCYLQEAGSLKEIAQECADVLKYLISLCLIFDINIYEEVMEKHAYNMIRFPANMFTELDDYSESYKGQKKVVVRDRMKQDFYEDAPLPSLRDVTVFSQVG